MRLIVFRYRKSVLALLILAVFLMSNYGCGYSFRGGAIPAHIKTISVILLKNNTQKPGIETIITSAVEDAFIKNGRLRVVSEKEAEIILSGEINSYSLEGLSFDTRSNVKEYRLKILLNLVLKDTQKGSIMWKENNIEEKSDYKVSGTVTQTMISEDEALKHASEDIARSIVNRVLEGF